MKNRTIRNGTRLLTVLLLCALLCGAGMPKEAAAGAKVLAGLKPDETLMEKQNLLPAGTSVCDWLAVAFAMSDVEDNYATYLSALEAYVTDQYEKNGGLDSVKATEWHRIALTVLALGGDPTSFGTCDGKPINLIADGTYAYRGTLSTQGNNGLIWALITLDAGAYPVPADSAYTRESILSELLQEQCENGGFALSGDSADVDITAMALTALSPYVEQADVKTAVDAALHYLSEQQTDNGGFRYGEAESSESASQVVIALSALGIDADGDERFMKNGNSVYDALLAFQTSNGSFRHTMEDEGDIMATEQAMLALLAYSHPHRSIYAAKAANQSDVKPTEQLTPATQEPSASAEQPASPEVLAGKPLPLSAVLCACIGLCCVVCIVLILMKRRRLGR